MDVAQGGIVQSGLPQLGGGDGAVGGIGIGGVAVEQEQGVALVALGLEALQKARGLGGGEGRAVDPAVQLLDGEGGDLLGPEEVDVLRPGFPDPDAVLPVGVMVARGNEDRDLHPLKGAVDGLVALPGVGTVENVACQQGQIAVLPEAEIGDLSGQGKHGAAQLPALMFGEISQRGIDVPVCGVQYSDHWISTLSTLVHRPVAASMVNRTALSLVGPGAA